MRTRVGKAADGLRCALAALAPAEKDADKAADTKAGLAAAVEMEHKALALRHALVARRRELLAELGARRQKEEAARCAEAGRHEREDARRCDVQRLAKIQEEAKMADAERYKAALVEKGILKAGDSQVRLSFCSSSTCSES